MEKLTEETPGIAASLFRISSSIRTTRSRLSVRYLRFRDVKTECLHRIGRDETRRHMHQGAKGADHQPGTDQQDQRKRHLHHNQRLARAMPFAALAQRAATLAQAAVRARARILEDWD